MIECALVELDLGEHREKEAGKLSGGNKRKLAVAIAILGSPSIILLDEPSAGMDPQARRHMWNVVANLRNSAVVLSSHLMEEAEALSTRMGIMVKGGMFRCCGTAQHIKNKYGTGLEFEVKTEVWPVERLEEVARVELDGFLMDTEPKRTKVHHLLTQLLEDKKITAIEHDQIARETVKYDDTILAHIFMEKMMNARNAHGIVKGMCEAFGEVDLLE